MATVEAAVRDLITELGNLQEDVQNMSAKVLWQDDHISRQDGQILALQEQVKLLRGRAKQDPEAAPVTPEQQFPKPSAPRLPAGAQEVAAKAQTARVALARQPVLLDGLRQASSRGFSGLCVARMGRSGESLLNLSVHDPSGSVNCIISASSFYARDIIARIQRALAPWGDESKYVLLQLSEVPAMTNFVSLAWELRTDGRKGKIALVAPGRPGVQGAQELDEWWRAKMGL